MAEKSIIMYSIPAYGHIYSNLYLMQRLNQDGFQVIYYALPPYRKAVEASGCIYRQYPIDEAAIDLTDGKRLLRLYRLLLEYTAAMLPVLLDEVQNENPAVVIFDSLAPWGRAVGDILRIPTFSFYSVLAINGIFRKSFFSYGTRFGGDFLRYGCELPAALRWRRQLRKQYGLKKLGILPVLMNKGDYQLLGFSRQIQPGGARFNKSYLFLGPMSRYRPGQDGSRPQLTQKKLIYISLGTIFNDDRELFDAAVACWGGKPVQVVMAAKIDADMRSRLPDNFIAEPFLNQREMLKKASLFLSAGGMNSAHEAIALEVPCLFYPKQGEQLLNARQLERLGFGLILTDPARLRVMANRAVRLRQTWSKNLHKKITRVTINEAMRTIRSAAAEGGRQDE